MNCQKNILLQDSHLLNAAIALGNQSDKINYISSLNVAVGKVLVVFDSRVCDLPTFLNGLVEGAIPHILGADEDALTTITQLLTKTGAKQLAIVAHGEPGVMYIGANPLNLEQLHRKAYLLQEWGIEEIALYSCEVAKGDRGQAFIHNFSQMTGANIAASATKIGNNNLGGNWHLEIATAPINPRLAFLPSVLSQYRATLGNEFRVNTTTNGDQWYSSVTALSDGGFVVTWSSSVGDGNGWGIYGQRYNASGAAIGSQFLINTTTANDQQYSSVTALSDGGFVVTWSSNGQDGNGWGIYGRRYNASGTAGSAFLINTTTANDQLYSSVTALSDGGFVVTWSSNGQDGNGWGIYGRRYNASGTAGSQFLINTTTTNDQQYSSVTALSDGGFVVTWSSNGQDGNGWGIYGQRYNASGAVAGSQFRINTTTNGDQQYSSVAGLADSSFVVTWSSSVGDSSGWGIFGQRYNTNGTAEGLQFRINTTTTNDQLYSSVTALSVSDGGFVVIWSSSGQDGNGWGVYGRRYNASGTAIGTEFLINQTTSGDQWNQTFANGTYSVDQLANGNLVVTWYGNGSGDSTGVFARIFEPPVLDLNGNTTGNDFSATFTEDAAATSIVSTVTSGLTLSEPENQNIFSATITITNLLDGNAESLAANTSGTGITASYNTTTGTLTLTGTVAASVYQTVLRSITYRNTSQNPNTTPRNISFVVTDISGTTSIDRISTVSVISVNDAPSGSNKTITTNEDTAYIFTVSDFGFSDIENHAFNRVRITTVPAAGNLTLNDAAVIAGTFINVSDIIAGNFRFTPALNANGNNYALFTFQVEDNGGTANNGVNLDQSPNSITIDVTPVNDDPVLTPPNPIAYFDTANDDNFLPVTGTLTITAEDAGQTLTYGLVGAIADSTLSGFTLSKTGTYGKLYLNSSTGAYRFVSNDTAIESLKTNTSESFIVTVTNGDGGTDSKSLNIDLTGVNDTPTLTATVSAASYIDTANNDSFNAISGQLISSDRDSDDSFTYGIVGGTDNATTSTKVGNYGTLSLNKTTGAYTFTPDDA
ncbi:DUF4347 domain-containing protein, partial [Calothrix sp. FACHB-1219]|uniref:DUF4347 domain-containing protein n=1 Tax=unclassified Calothrix TaxID=2619626 RepID=UPI001685BF26